MLRPTCPLEFASPFGNAFVPDMSRSFGVSHPFADNTTTEIQQQSYAGTEETADILDRAEARIFGITDQRIRQGFVSVGQLLKPTFDNIQKLFDRKVQVTGVPTGWDDLDKLTSGWQPGDLVILAGRPATGKTSDRKSVV